MRPGGRGVMSAQGFSPPLPAPNPHPIGLCERCQTVVWLDAADIDPESVHDSLAYCPVCSFEDRTLRVIDAREPKGFFTDLVPRDFDGQFDWRPRSTRPTMAVRNEQTTPPTSTNNMLVRSLSDEVLSLNDGGGRGGFDFQAASIFGSERSGAYAVNSGDGDQGRVTTSGDVYRVALLSRRKTDIMLTQMNDWPAGVFADPLTVEGRAAWYSFAFWLRLAAGFQLDIDPLELQSGFRSVSQDNRVVGQAFLCDQLENGAGYCRELAHPNQLSMLLQQGDATRLASIAAKWANPLLSANPTLHHSLACDTSCNRCLRDYHNLAYHGLLDWRLGLEMARLAVSPTAVISLDESWGDCHNPWLCLVRGPTAPIPVTLERLGFIATEKFARLRGYVHRNAKLKKLLIERHPLWQDDHEDWQVATREATAHYPLHDVAAVNPFRVLRRPADSISASSS